MYDIDNSGDIDFTEMKRKINNKHFLIFKILNSEWSVGCMRCSELTATWANLKNFSENLTRTQTASSLRRNLLKSSRKTRVFWMSYKENLIKS